MIVHLSPELEKFVQSKVRSGLYNSESEVVRDALVLLGQLDEGLNVPQDELRKQIEEGWLSARRGEFVDGDEVFDRIEAELQAIESSGHG